MRFKAPVAIVLALLAVPAAAETFVGVPIVADGDTLRFGDQRIRLFGIDAPELNQTCPAAGGGTWHCGAAAAERLAELVASGSVQCVGDEIDDFGRTLAICTTADGFDINAGLVAEGLAWAFDRYSDLYSSIEALAREAGRGVWQADTLPAWQHRANANAAVIAGQPQPPDPSCIIKGNISRGGEHIYHLPGAPGYVETVIRVEDGERWFCSETEAAAAGWRPRH